MRRSPAPRLLPPNCTAPPLPSPNQVADGLLPPKSPSWTASSPQIATPLYMDGKVYLLDVEACKVLAFDVDGETVSTIALPGKRVDEGALRAHAVSGFMEVSGRVCVATAIWGEEAVDDGDLGGGGERCRATAASRPPCASTPYDESKYLVVRNVPSLGCGDELTNLFGTYGPVEECKPMDAEDCEPYTDVFFIKFAQRL